MALRRLIPYLMAIASAAGSMTLAGALDFHDAKAYVFAFVVSLPVLLLATFMSPGVIQQGPSGRRPPRR